MNYQQLIPYRVVIFRRKLKPLWKKITQQNMRKKSKIPILHIHLADHCNLNCRGCDNFSPLAPKVFADISIVTQDLKRISELSTGRVRDIQLLGGEPLLHKQVTDFFHVTRKYFPKTSIKMITNGILLFAQTEDFWKSCRENKIEIIVTKYPIKIDHNAIKQLVKSKKIMFNFYGRTEMISKSMQCVPLDITGCQNRKDSFLRCSAANRCIALDNGKIYTCTTIPYIKYFNNHFNQNLEVSKHDYINIYEAKNFDEIMTFLSKPMPFCRFCNQKGIIWDIGYGVSKGKIEEWTGKSCG
ncbi:MAG: radical SAM protein [Marinilabiliaceae bacterium]|nr:radical SAM protein [Marinilabiliaceae bacterium]